MKGLNLVSYLDNMERLLVDLKNTDKEMQIEILGAIVEFTTEELERF